MAKRVTAEVISIGGGVPTNGAANKLIEPYVASVTISGVADYLYHRYNCESVAESANAAKGSKAKKKKKKTDDLESYVYRNDAGFLCVPGTQLRMALVYAAKFLQDPRSPRKSAMDLFKAGIVVLTDLASVGTKNWHYEHRCRAVIQRNAITRVRPALKTGWELDFDIQVLLPEYISPDILNSALTNAGRFCALGDFRPTYGRFQTTKFKT
jgi:hypothetical protein